MTGEPLGDAVAELYKVTGRWLRNFQDRPDYIVVREEAASR
jgi:hypothetical protein